MMIAHLRSFKKLFVKVGPQKIYKIKEKAKLFLFSLGITIFCGATIIWGNTIRYLGGLFLHSLLIFVTRDGKIASFFFVYQKNLSKDFKKP